MSSSFNQWHFVHVQASGQMGGYVVLVTARLTWISLIFKKCVFTFSGGFHYFFLIVVLILVLIVLISVCLYFCSWTMPFSNQFSRKETCQKTNVKETPLMKECWNNILYVSVQVLSSKLSCSHCQQKRKHSLLWSYRSSLKFLWW